MEEDIKYFEFDDEVIESVSIRMVLALFKSIYKEEQINKKEYDALVNMLCRTFNII